MAEEHKEKFSFEKFHDKHYKLLLIIPISMILFCFIYMSIFYSQQGDFIRKDISLTGGTSITLYEKLDKIKVKADLSDKLEDLEIREISDLLSGEQKAIVLETRTDGDQARAIIEEYVGYRLSTDNSSFEFTGASLSESFYKQLLIAILVAFVLMALVIFIMFRTFVPSSAVVISAFADIFMTLVTANLLGMRISSAGIIAFLMLIGYSVDTDILLTNRVLKRGEGTLNSRIYNSFKTGVTMTLVAIVSVAVALVIVSPFSSTLSQIFAILLIGLFFDLFNTWITNVSIIKWYMVNKHKHEA